MLLILRKIIDTWLLCDDKICNQACVAQVQASPNLASHPIPMY